MALVEGQLIGSYQVLSLLGQGGMATVYKAYHPRLDRYVALKMMHTSFLSDPQFVARFEREAQIIARLEHPNIVPVHDYADFEGQPYLVMKFIPGISLKDALSDGPLELRDTMLLISAIAKALDYAHHHGVLHRDIKPSNIMLDTNATPYLTDFGLARTVQDGESSLSQGMLIGTPAYISPEQAAGRPLDARSDLYSLGIVLYELLVGQAPFGGGTTYTTLHAHLTEAPAPPSSINPEIPPAVELVLLKALSKDPEDRYSSASAMYDELKNALLQSNVRRFSQEERHTLAVSLAKPRESSLLVRVDTPKPSTVPSARTNASIPVEAAAPRKTAAPRQPAPSAKQRGSSNGIIWLGFGVLIALVAVLIGGVLLNNARAQGLPASTLVAVVPTNTVIIVTRQQPPTYTPLPPTPTITPAPQVVANRPTQISQQPATSNQSQQSTRRGSGGGLGRLPPLNTTIRGYDVPRLSLQDAEAAIRADPNEPTGYLALAGAMMQTRPPRSVNEIEETLLRGARQAVVEQYIVSVLELVEDRQAPPDLLFSVYNNLLLQTRGTELQQVVRERAGAHLYDLATQTETVPVFIVTALNNSVDTSYDPIFPALLARMLITHNNLRLAAAALYRSEGDTPEKALIQGDLLEAQGDLNEALRTHLKIREQAA